MTRKEGKYKIPDARSLKTARIKTSGQAEHTSPLKKQEDHFLEKWESFIPNFQKLKTDDYIVFEFGVVLSAKIPNSYVDNLRKALIAAGYYAVIGQNLNCMYISLSTDKEESD